MKKLAPYLLLIPALVFFAVFSVGPVFILGRLSMLQTDFLRERWVGFGNFARIARDGTYWRSVGNTLLYAAFVVPMQAGASLLVALAVIDGRKGLQNYVRFAFYLPGFANPIIMTAVWRWIFHPTREGLANYFLSLLKLEPVVWFGVRLPAIWVISLIICTYTLGGNIIIYLATMLGVPSELYDAAQVDGASWRQIKTRIILPLIFPTVSLLSLLSLIGAMQIWALVHQLTGGGPAGGTSTVMYNIYLDSFLYSRHGLAAAKSAVLVVVIVLLNVVKRRIERLAGA